MKRKENEAFTTSLYEIDRILEDREQETPEFQERLYTMKFQQ